MAVMTLHHFKCFYIEMIKHGKILVPQRIAVIALTLKGDTLGPPGETQSNNSASEQKLPFS